MTNNDFKNSNLEPDELRNNLENTAPTLGLAGTEDLAGETEEDAREAFKGKESKEGSDDEEEGEEEDVEDEDDSDPARS